MSNPHTWSRQSPDLVLGLHALALKSHQALLIRLMMNSIVDIADSQTIGGQLNLSVGWMLSGDGLPVPMTQIAAICHLASDVAASSMGELIEAGIAVRSDQGAWGLTDWSSTQPEARKRYTDRARRRAGAPGSDEVSRGSGHFSLQTRDTPAQRTASSPVVADRVSPLTLPSSLSLSEQRQENLLSLPEVDQTQEIMILWASLREDLGITKRARPRSANAVERKGMAKVPAEDMKTALRRMAESLRRDSERAGGTPHDVTAVEGCKWFTVEHLLREANRQRYLDAEDLDERKPQRARQTPAKPMNGSSGHFRPERATEAV